MASILLVVALGAFAFLGAATQRITGMGFAVVSGPLFVLALGPNTAVPLAQVLSFVVCAIVLAFTYRDAEWRKAVWLMIPGALGLIPGYFLIRALSPPMMSIVIGSMILIAIVAMLASERARVFKGQAGLVSAGFLSSFMNVTAAVGGPAMVLYRISTNWDHKKFVATVQVFFLFINATALGVRGMPSLSLVKWIVVVGSLLVGLIVGQWLSTRMDSRLAGRLVVAIAIIGSVSTIVNGATQLAG